MRKILLILVTVFLTIGLCSADPIPPDYNSGILQIIAPIALNYVWNFAILAFVLHRIVKVNLRFALFILILTVLGLLADLISLIVCLKLPSWIGFTFWILFAGIVLFALSFSLAKTILKVSTRFCTIAGIVYAIFSHPIIGIKLILPVLDIPTPL